MRSKASQRKGGGGYSLANTTRHYNSAGERRAHGVGFYAFSQDEDERQRQMRELIEMRSQVRILANGYAEALACLLRLEMNTDISPIALLM